MSTEILSAGEASEVPAKRVRLLSPEADTPEKPLTQEHIFENLRLRRIVRENHNNTVAQIALMFYRPGDAGLEGHGTGGMPAYERSFDKRGGALREPDDNSNLLVSAGHTQASVFDNENCGDHLDIMSHFQVDSGLVFRSCCWIRVAEDAVFAAAGDDKLVHLISLAWTREIRVLRGHTEAIVDLQPHPTDCQLLLSVSNDQTVRIWSVLSGQCLCVYNYSATAARFHPNGKSVFVGTSAGEVRQWPVPDLSGGSSEPLVFTVGDSTLIVAAKRGMGSAIDCMQFANSNILIKNMAGRIEYWDLEAGVSIRSFSVRHHGVNVSRFDVSFDDKYICVGNSRGEVFVFSIESGKTVCRLAHKRSVRPVTCSIFSRDCRSVVYAGEGGFIWRYDYVDDETLAEWEKPDESVSNEELSE
ncbi:hypothetical protein GGH17_004168 [Coemansia sp. RSA 788]|nr:hypothetical protein GGH17_004168 [Coemansia sp. RSA 788]KAJ2144835.1 hypothetical protein IW142_002931 [Coemansia sp. RSA 564]KAJ2156069.1 hypothetical protein GGH15_005639 [Coemansia sp. RSA 562]